MCGLVGYIKYTTNKKIDIEQMLSMMKHRGPDAQNYKIFNFSNNSVALGHARLSIQDLSHSADQPMSDDTEKYHIVYNGEVYNFKEIREKLNHKYSFATTSDTEVILYAYREWGTECVNKFIGMFSIVILDLLENQVIFINDRLGVKPLYIYEDNEILIFSSELKGILQYQDIDKTIDKSALTQFMQYGYIQPPLSIFEKIRKIEPGSIIKVDITTKEKEILRYWSVEDCINSSKEYNLTDLEKTISKASNYRMVSDVPVSFFLSSGVDSALTVAILSQEQKLHTITIGVNDVRYNEAELAKNIAKQLNTFHTEKYIDKNTLVSLFDLLPYYYDEPFADPSIFPTYLVSKIASENYKVAISSDGGDEAFGGYHRYLYFNKYYKFIARIPNLLKKILIYTLTIMQKTKLFNLMNIQMISLKIKKIKNSLDAQNISEFYENLNKYISNDRASKILLDPSFERGYYKLFDEINEKYKNDILNAAMAIDYKTYTYKVLTKLDRASMANSLEVREPLLDHHIIEMALNIPSLNKIQNNTTKIPLRKILKKYLNLNCLTKNKKGFSIPIEKWLKEDLREVVEKYTSKEAILKSAVFNYDEVNHIKNMFYTGKDDYVEIWHILTFQLWYNEWIERLYEKK